ncbi:MAG: trypsin-like peptidase domain-containing protein [Gloeomargarita sp. SKYG116]|nr:trypsin-like peptidase domain-containing protein [Gloeomargarita sp. SKYG116]MCS7226702.1 trypsin-like peptidase domain-containing protein [Gloeomargarita sp. SKYB31]MDW8400139.1 HhoA/HhoB/HtrA family serine endopeptidase [Gloeomargarita sp. SKYGB_i_bin116]
MSRRVRGTAMRPKAWFQLLTHTLAVLVGVVVTVIGFHALPSQADPLDQVVANSPVALTGSNRPTASNFVVAAVQKVGPAVVRIDTERTVSLNIDPFFDDPFFRRFFGEFNIPRERTERGQGSGFIIDKNGTIITNAHVVEGAQRVTVTLTDGRRLPARVRGTDEVTDLAVLKLENPPSNLPVAPLGDSSKLQVGDWAIAVGNPLGLDNTVTLGIISNLRRSSSEVGIPDKRLNFIQTDAAINPGNSGGPLLNANGEVIGINTAIRAGAEGIGFAIPVDLAKSIAPILAEGKTVPHPYIGVTMSTLTPELARQINSDPNSLMQVPEINGVIIRQVLPRSPAAEAGLRRGDVIVEVEGQKVTKAEDLQRIVEQSQVGQRLQMRIRRGDQTLSLNVRTGDRKQVLGRQN